LHQQVKNTELSFKADEENQRTDRTMEFVDDDKSNNSSTED